MNTFKILVIDRHRMNTDGKGVTTLVALSGCPLKCDYCINKKLLAEVKYDNVSPKDLLDMVIIDYCYFYATGGGITFGGGEPLMQSKAIVDFVKLMPVGVKVNLETSLNVPIENLLDIIDDEKVVERLGELCIDIKGLNPEIYEAYTKFNIDRLVSNISEIVKRGLQHKCKIRVPNIKNYTTVSDIDNSIKRIRELGFSNIDTFDYIIKEEV